LAASIAGSNPASPVSGLLAGSGGRSRGDEGERVRLITLRRVLPDRAFDTVVSRAPGMPR
jgi:hypothetical protein